MLLHGILCVKIDRVPLHADFIKLALLADKDTDAKYFASQCCVVALADHGPVFFAGSVLAPEGNGLCFSGAWSFRTIFSTSWL